MISNMTLYIIFYNFFNLKKYKLSIKIFQQFNLGYYSFNKNVYKYII